MKRIYPKFFNLKLRTKLFLSFLSIIFISTVLVNYLIYRIYESDSINKSVLLSQNLVQQLADNVSNKAKNFNDNVLLKIQMVDIFSNGDFPNNLLYTKRSQSIGEFASILSGDGVNIKNIFINDTANEEFYYDKNQPDNSEYKNTNIYKYIRDNYGSIKNKWGAPTWVTFKNEVGVIYTIRSVIDTKTMKFKGVIGIGIDDSYFKGLYSNLEQANGGSIVVYNTDSRVIATTGDTLDIAENFKNYIPQNKEMEKQYIQYKKDKYIITGSVSSDTKWKVLYLISSKDLLKDAVKIKFRIVIFCLISVIFALIIAIIISDRMTSNIRLLLKKIRLLGQGNFSLKIEPNYHDEVGELFQEFNEMSVKLNDLIKKIAFEQVEKQKAEYNALQAQINPHFLYNTLESINSFAKINGQDEIVNIIQSLSYLLRMSISGKKSVVKLSDEIDYVKNYLLIQKTILGDRIHVEYDIDSLVLDCQVPKLILQPIIENAILHGIEDMKEGGLIIISAHMEKNLLINISDNGKGMNIDTMNQMLDETYQDEKHTRIGIKSVNKRIKILYGEEYGISISSELGIGTVVKIIIPINMNGGFKE